MKKFFILLAIGIFIAIIIANKKNIGEYIDMKEEQLNNAYLIIKELRKAGITNPYTIAGILTVVYKESELIPRTEKGYSATSNDRIRFIFPSLKRLNNVQLDVLKKDDIKFFDTVYGKRYGNELPGDGFKFRGRGFNQLTFRGNYSLYSALTGIDLLKNPDSVNNPEIAARVVASFFKNTPQKAKTPETGFIEAYQINAGKGTNINTEFHKSVIEKYLPDTLLFTNFVKTK